MYVVPAPTALVPAPAPIPPPGQVQAKNTHDAFLSTLASFTRPLRNPLPPRYVRFDKNALAQPEVVTLMGYKGVSDANYPNVRK